MNKRLQTFLSSENISQSEFADTIGVARASVSHIIAGRNKPGCDFLSGMALHYPSLNMDWILTGRGKMYVNSRPEPVSEPSAEQSADSVDLFAPVPSFMEPVPAVTLCPENEEIPTERPDEANKKTITRVTVFYSDGTFDELF